MRNDTKESGDVSHVMFVFFFKYVLNISQDQLLSRFSYSCPDVFYT